MAYSSPLRYPGGKRQITNFIKLVITLNDLYGGHYIEPYAGGASVAFTLLFHEYVKQVHINDLNTQIYSFWHSVLNQVDSLCSLINETQINMDTWYEQKTIYENPHNHDMLSVGFATFFLNRTNRSGILNGGVMGGKNQTGKYKIDCRFNKPNLIKRIKRIARYRERVNLYNLDAMKLLTTVVPNLPENNTLLYLDPPYYTKGKALYHNHYKHQDHASIASFIRDEIKQPWIVSYDNTPAILDLYSECPQIAYDLRYSATAKYDGAEIMFFSDKLTVPQISNPAKVSPRQISRSISKYIKR